MGKKLTNLQMDEISLVRKGFRPKNPEATIEFFKAYPDEAATETSEGGFFSRIRKAFERITKGAVADKVNRDRPHREINEALWALSDALDDIRWGWQAAGMTDEQKRQAMHDVIDEGAKLMHESVDKIGQTDVTKAMDTKSGANYEQQDLSTNSPGKKKKKSADDPDDDGDIDDSDPALDTDNDKGKGKVKKAVDEFKKAIEDALATVPETIKKAVEDATQPAQEAISKAQEDVKAAFEKATADISSLVESAKQEIAKAVDDAKIELGRISKAQPGTTQDTPVIKSDTAFGDAIRTLMNS
ncbi:hypothetical protein GCM10025857_14930 [Alicyclobacillus contaminans]|uniref:hypothetical protein n=1 Tax=Alicyclobacillus contaminans TaxID=392016 RepID=UPI000420EF15|nr:hypothetical protein [Alicyclobacillus contaminans]GMA50136.1 hypothetical protein GCM10025857_14930 [Alicyclobacillus contaminans]